MVRVWDHLNLEGIMEDQARGRGGGEGGDGQGLGSSAFRGNQTSPVKINNEQIPGDS